MKKIGVLALQGDFALHIDALNTLGVATTLVKKPTQLDDLDGLIIPGGESTTLLKLMQPWPWETTLQNFHAAGKGLFGTCAGCILLANTVQPEQSCLKLIDINVHRNAYGRQADSFVDRSDAPFEQQELTMVFIRAPQINQCGNGVTVLAQHQSQTVLAQQKNVLVATFHPEMTTPFTLHQYFIHACC